MPKNRLTSANTGIQTVEQFHDHITRIAQTELEIQEKETERDQAIDKLKEETSAAVDGLKESIVSDYTACHSFATNNRKKLFHGKAKTAENAFAQFGFRKSPDRIEYLPGVNEDSVIAKAKELGLTILIKLKRSIIKSELKKLPEGVQKQLGVTVTKREEFFVKPKAESLQS